VDVDQEADRTDPDGPVQEGERRHGGRLHLEEGILELHLGHLTEELLHLKQEEVHLKKLHLREVHLKQEELLLVTNVVVV